MKLINYLIIFFSLIIILYFGKFLLLPLFLALFLYIIINSISKDFIKICKKIGIKINELISFFGILLVSFLFFYFILKILKINVSSALQNVTLYENNLKKVIFKLSDISLIQIFPFKNFLTEFNFVNLFSNLLNFLTSFAGNLSLIIVYLIFIAIEDKLFQKKIKKVFISKTNLKVFSKINNDIYNYFRIKTFTSLLTAILTFLILFLNHSDLSVAFGVIALPLNFIPYIGSIVAIIFPTIFAFIQSLDFTQPILIFILLVIVHILIGNFLETKLMGKALNISPIIILIFLSLMSQIWGIIGMFLSVPILVVLLIILNNFKETKKIALLLSETGKLKK